MSQTMPCCQAPPFLTQIASPFDAVIALGYYDGPDEGMVRCGSCRREFRFKLLDSRFESDDETETRIFGLSPIPEGSLSRFTAAMTRYQEARSPNWVLLWAFPTEEEREQMDDLVAGIFDQARPMELVVASSPWLSGEILAARSISDAETVEGIDWFSKLGLLRAVVED